MEDTPPRQTPAGVQGFRCRSRCRHEWILRPQEEYRGKEGDTGAVDRLVLTSGKMVLLDKLLTRLRETGHRSVRHATRQT